ncbi:MAG: aldehyde dehydrogenase, partial [Anaerococcus sp.]|nr:aldehyde dehydrogenase [Anaerococcus sp.]
MKVIDTDLLSVQQARILLEQAECSRENLLDIDKETRDDLLKKIKEYYKTNIDQLAKMSFEETSYGKYEDEIKLGKYYLDNLENEINSYPQIFDIVNEKNSKQVALSKGVSLVFIAPYLSTLTSFQAIYFAIRALNPLIIVSDARCRKTVTKMVCDIKKILKENFYPRGFLDILTYNSNLGEKTLYE